MNCKEKGERNSKEVEDNERRRTLPVPDDGHQADLFKSGLKYYRFDENSPPLNLK